MLNTSEENPSVQIIYKTPNIYSADERYIWVFSRFHHIWYSQEGIAFQIQEYTVFTYSFCYELTVYVVTTFCCTFPKFLLTLVGNIYRIRINLPQTPSIFNINQLLMTFAVNTFLIECSLIFSISCSFHQNNNQKNIQDNVYLCR